MPGVHKKNHGFDASWFTSLTKLLIEKCNTQDKIWVGRRRAAEDVWLRTILFILDLDSGRKYRSKSPESEGRYLLTGKSCKGKAVHNDVAATKYFISGSSFCHKRD